MSFVDRFHDNVAGNTVSGVICSPSLSITKVLRLLSSRYNRVWCGLSSRFTVENIFSLMDTDSNVDVADDTSYKIKPSGVVISTGSVLRNKILKSFEGDQIKHIDFTDVIVIDGVTRGTIDAITVMALWNKTYTSSRGNRIPRLVVLLDSMEVPENIPLDMPYTHGDDPIYNVSYKTQDTVNVIRSRNAKDNISISYVVYCEDEEMCSIIAKKLSRLPNSKIFQVGKKSTRSKIVELDTANIGKRKIIITSEEMLYHRNCIVFDELRCKVRGEIRYTSKTVANTRAMYAKDCIRIGTVEEFDAKATVHNTPEYKTCHLYGLFTEIINANVDPMELFEEFIDPDIISDTIANLKRKKMISSSKTILKAGNLFLRLPLSHNSSGIIHHSIERSYPLFPFVVLAVFVEMGETEFFVERPEVDKDTSMLTSHLLFWEKYADEVMTLKPAKKVLVQWCKANLLHPDPIMMLCKTIIACFNIIEVMYQKNFIIGKFSTSNLINAAKPIIEEVFKDEIYLLSADGTHYVDSSDRRFLLPDDRIEPATRIIALTKTHNKITSFYPDNVIFSENKVISSTSMLKQFISEDDLPFEVIDLISTIFEKNVTERIDEGDSPEDAVDTAIKAVNRLTKSQFSEIESNHIDDIINNVKTDVVAYIKDNQREDEESDEDEIPGLIPEFDE
jgi:hypothetical protein